MLTTKVTAPEGDSAGQLKEALRAKGAKLKEQKAARDAEKATPQELSNIKTEAWGESVKEVDEELIRQKIWDDAKREVSVADPALTDDERKKLCDLAWELWGDEGSRRVMRFTVKGDRLFLELPLMARAHAAAVLLLRQAGRKIVEGQITKEISDGLKASEEFTRYRTLKAEVERLKQKRAALDKRISELEAEGDGFGPIGVCDFARIEAASKEIVEVTTQRGILDKALAMAGRVLQQKRQAALSKVESLRAAAVGRAREEILANRKVEMDSFLERESKTLTRLYTLDVAWSAILNDLIVERGPRELIDKLADEPATDSRSGVLA